MPVKKIVKNQAGVEEGNNSEYSVQKLTSVTRREFLQKSMMVTSSLALTAMLPSFIPENWATVAAQTGPCTPGQTLNTIMEIPAHRTSPTSPGTLQAVLKVLNENKQYLAASVTSGNPPVCNNGQMRYISGYDKTNPSKVWPQSFPETKGSPAPAPTLRCRVGDTVQVTLLNQVKVSDFGKTLDVVETGTSTCDTSITPKPDGSGGVNTYPGDPSFETPPNCFHGSSSTNLHYHGTHVSPNSIADYVLANTRPSPRDSSGKPTVDEAFVEADFAEIFKMCADGHSPQLWHDLPKTWQDKQEALLKNYDLTAPWKGVNGPVNGKPALPPDQQLWPKDEAAINSCMWPQYYIGAYPSCFVPPIWKKGDPTSPQMGQAPGTHWYHSHKHGSTALNLANGMAGALIIEGEYDEKLRPFFVRERVLVLQQYGAQINLMKSGINDQGQANTNIKGDLVFVNGQYTPVLQMNPNEMQLWRIVNACHRAQIALSAPPNGIKWVQTAQDGVQFDKKNYNPAVTNAAISVPAAINSSGQTGGSLAAGNRIDFLVQAPSTPGTFNITFGRGTLLFTVKVAQDTSMPVIKDPMPFPTKDQFPIIPEFLWDIDPAKVTVRRSLHFASIADPSLATPANPHPAANRGTNAPSYPPPTHIIDGKKFNNQIDQSMVLGATEEWTIYNDSTGAAHPFHIHINPFQVTEIFNPAGGNTTPAKLPPPWIWWDDFAIPPAYQPPTPTGGTAPPPVPGYFKMLTRFVDFAGIYVLHCHILGHEDRGMMQLVQVVSNTGHVEHN